MSRAGLKSVTAPLAVLLLTALPLSAVEAAAGAAPPKAVDWPHYRFDEKHTGYQKFETTLNKNNIQNVVRLWHGFLGGELVYQSSAAVADGVAYIGEEDGTLSAIAADGCGSDSCRPLWQSSYLAQVTSSPAVANGIVYVGSQTGFDDNSGKLNAFDAKGCGKDVCPPLWQGKMPTGDSGSSPIVDNGLVYIGNDGLYVFDAEGCGKKLCDPLWKGKVQGGIGSTAVVYKGVVYVGSSHGALDGRLYAFDAKGCGKAVCKPLWSGDTHGATYDSSPAIYKGIVYIGSYHAISAFDAKGCGAQSCAPVWQVKEDDFYFYGSPAVANDRVYIDLEDRVAVYNAVGCKNCQGNASLFGSGNQAAFAASPVVANGLVYGARNTGELFVWPADCKGSCYETKKWLLDDPLLNSSPTIVNGKIYIGSSEHGFGGRLDVFGLPD
ncbi:MAG: PQQ-binding-like beta-propeller repeat protein [Alphaproteobacteria bacterium]|nr:PQQ-binding-like beta-propeller repeat protein [Alphaproteobacteria bacterium]